MNWIYIFLAAIHTEDIISLDLEENRLSFFCNGKRVFIELNALRSGSSTVILKNPLTGSLYPLFNFREILQVMDLGSQELLRTLQLNAYVQIDKSGKDTFIKVFLPMGQGELKSRTHDFSNFPYVAMADLHKLDRDFSWAVKDVKAQIHYGRIEGSLVFERSTFWKEPVYVSHAGQTQELTEGKNYFSFSWSPTEDVYCGPKYGRYKGRALHLTPGC
ncbi:hypothetical protein LQE88_09995 [Acidaminococcus sp. NSJ-142]|uniref:hypothetical protein n=1 Tax=Acidaminococcus hominis TaxID=2897706 RepID=UPI001E50F354|nr:hypothetical protein [Acidaminococcus hominis]MCD2436309.1 hypothetical protein [Acidaminococcus hominis]